MSLWRWASQPPTPYLGGLHHILGNPSRWFVKTHPNPRMSTNFRFWRSLRCTNSVSRKETKNHPHWRARSASASDRTGRGTIERSNLGGFCVREKSRQVLDAASTTIGSQWPSLCLVLSL